MRPSVHLGLAEQQSACYLGLEKLALLRVISISCPHFIKYNPVIYTMGSRFQCWPKPHFPPAMSVTCACSSFTGYCLSSFSSYSPGSCSQSPTPTPDYQTPASHWHHTTGQEKSLLQWPGWTICSF